jgi:NAD(P)-dependent dehydrogenase (short-subunit alcohol dehydrogenase family)
MRKATAKPLLSGQVALITGANQGIGLALAKALAREGCKLVLAARNSKNLEKAGREVARLGADVTWQPCDVRDPDSVKDLAAHVRKTYRRLNVLINNAGVAHEALPVEKLPLDQWRAVIETNLTGMFLVCHEMIPLMPRGSAIVNNLSVAANRVFPNWSAYSASKHGALGLTNTLREELRPREIRVISVLPGATDTDIWNTPRPDAPRKKMMSAATVADAVVAALVLPANTTLEELTIRPSIGSL